LFGLAVHIISVVKHVITTYRARAHSGSLAFNLTSPSGTVSRLQEYHHDMHSDILNWRYQTIMNWGESAVGGWTLSIDVNPGSMKKAHWISWHVLVHTHSRSAGGLPAQFKHYQSYDPMNPQ
jgi:subtilisin-like proprotein convertase family protein